MARPSREAVEKILKSGLAEALGLDPEQIDPREPFASFGLDSRSAFSLTGDLAEWLDEDLPVTLFWDYPSIGELVEYIVGRPKSES